MDVKQRETIQKLKRFNWSIILFALLIIICVTIYTVVNGDTGAVAHQIDSGILGVGGNESTVFVQISNILSAELRKDLDIGEDVSGTSTEKVYMGKYMNEEFGTYDIYAYDKTAGYIIVYHLEGVLVYNCSSIQETETAYENLRKALGFS